MNGKRITTEEATIKTAAVEIKALTIGGKQVTLAVFRQLIEEPILDHDATMLYGKPWGIVNYHSGVGCDDFRHQPHLHVVWQKGGELRRAVVRSPRALDSIYGDEWLADYEEWYESLRKLDQLFIAV